MPGLVVAAGTCALRRHSRHGRQPDRRHGAAGLSGLALEIRRGHSHRVHSRLSRLPDNMTEPSVPAESMAGRAPMIPLDDALRPTWLFERDPARGLHRGGYYEQAEFAERRLAPVHRKSAAGGRGAVQCGNAGGSMASADVPNVGGICIGCTMPGFPDNLCRSSISHRAAAVSNAVSTYGRAIHALRRFTQASLIKNRLAPQRSCGSTARSGWTVPGPAEARKILPGLGAGVS